MAKKSEGADGQEGKSSEMSKAEAVRRSIQANGWDAPLTVHENFIRDQFGITMSRVQISQYKSGEKRRAGKKRRARRSREVVAGAGGAEQTSAPRSDTLLQFVSTVRRWEEKLGSKKVLEVIEALYKKG